MDPAPDAPPAVRLRELLQVFGTIGLTSFGGVLSWIVTAASVVALLLSKVHPFALLTYGVALFLVRALLLP